MGAGSKWTPGRARSDGSQAWDDGGQAWDDGGQVRDDGGVARNGVYRPRMAEITPGQKGGIRNMSFISEERISFIDKWSTYSLHSLVWNYREGLKTAETWIWKFSG